MAKRMSDAGADLALNYWGNDVSDVCICSAEPTTYTEAVTTFNLGAQALAGTPTLANGDTSGRKITNPQQASVAITTGGQVTHVANVQSVGSLLKYVTTTATTPTVTTSDTVTVNAWDIEIADPT